MDSRVFVQGLPPNLTDEELGKHFAMRYQITDAQVIPKRRIGFVGFRNYTLAKNAIQYFNKTYLRMHKISCSLAEPVLVEQEVTQAVKKDKLNKPGDQNKKEKKMKKGDKKGHESLGSELSLQSTGDHPAFRPYTPITKTASSLKRKRETDKDLTEGVNAAVQESFDVMQPPKRSKARANGEDNQEKRQKKTSAEPEITSSRTKPLEPNPEQETARGNKIEKKKKKKSKDSSKGASSHNGGKSIDSDDDSPQEHYADRDQHNVAASDADWLRSRTSRLLGLVDDDEYKQMKAMSETGQTSNLAEIGANAELAPANDSSDLENESTTDKDNSNSGSEDANATSIRANGRLFVRNLPYSANDQNLQETFSQFGNLEEVHVAIDSRSQTSKGFAHLQFRDPNDAVKAYKSLDRQSFQGRLLHILPASAKRQNRLQEYEISKLPLKKQKHLKQKAEASVSTFSWNSLYMNADAIMASVADRLGVAKFDVLDPTSTDAAVKQAHAETHVIQEAKSYFKSHGVNLDAFKNRQRGGRAILVKNFSYGVKDHEIRKLFEPFGEVTQLIMPPTGTIAIVELANAGQAQAAFKALAYRKLGDSILFLEKAPKDVLNGATTGSSNTESGISARSKADMLEPIDQTETVDTSTLFIRNLNFATTTSTLTELFRPLDGFLSAMVKTKPDPKKPGETLSMGFGFAEFRNKTQAQKAMAAMNGYNLEGHELLIRPSHRGLDAAEERRQEDAVRKAVGKKTKIIIKNLPFEATKKDVRALFGQYGQLRSVRVPKKFNSSTRGFAFADFVTPREAENAIEALKNSHLLGRKLVLEFAAADEVDPEREIERMQKKVGRQVDRVSLQKLTSSERKKFTIGGPEEEE